MELIGRAVSGGAGSFSFLNTAVVNTYIIYNLHNNENFKLSMKDFEDKYVKV